MGATTLAKIIPLPWLPLTISSPYEANEEFIKLIDVVRKLVGRWDDGAITPESFVCLFADELAPAFRNVQDTLWLA